MKRKTVRISLQGERYEVKGWGINELPGLSLVPPYRMGAEGPEVSDKNITVLVHDDSGMFAAFFAQGVKAMGAVLDQWQGGGADWTMDIGEGLGSGEFQRAMKLLYAAMQTPQQQGGEDAQP